MQGYALLQNRKGAFHYVSRESGVAAISRTHSGWGTHFVDFDNDGWKDLFVAQGHVMDNIGLTQPSLRYLEPPLLMRNVAGKFLDVSARAGDAFTRPIAARGAAFGDLDNDGWVDAVINCGNGPPVILRNRGGNGNHWLMVETVGTRGNRDGIGAKVRAVTADGRERHAMVSTAGSYASSNDRRVHFGLGTATRVKLLEVVWPSGLVQQLFDVAADRLVRIVESER